MVVSTSEAKRFFFLTAEDLKSVPRETAYGGFGTGRAAYMFQEDDLKEAAVAKYGEDGYAKKVAAQKKREANKRKREQDKENQYNEKINTNPEFAKEEQMKKQKADNIAQRNRQIAGDVWNLTMLSPKRVAGTEATLQIKEWPPVGMPGESTIDCSDLNSPAYSFGNIHGLNNSESDEEMVFETKWKVMGKRHTGTLTVSVLPSDNKDAKPDSLMVKGEFDSGVNDGVQSWTFKGYRDE